MVSRCNRRGCLHDVSSGIWYFAAVHSAPASYIKSPSGWRSTTGRPLPLFAERDAERDPDVRSGAKLAPGVTVGSIEVPQLSRPLMQRLSTQSSSSITRHTSSAKRDSGNPRGR